MPGIFVVTKLQSGHVLLLQAWVHNFQAPGCAGDNIFLRWRLMFVGPEYEISLWRLDFCKMCAPPLLSNFNVAVYRVTLFSRWLVFGSLRY